MNYTDDELTLIRQHETDAITKADAALQAEEHTHKRARAQLERWDQPDFVTAVTEAKRARNYWIFVLSVIIASFFMNCILIQELTPDFAPHVSRLTGLSTYAANVLATGLLSALLFGLLLTIKDKGNTQADFAALRPGLHPAVSKPIHFRIRWKTSIKVIYLLALALGYHALYEYIAGGVALEQTAADSIADMAKNNSTTIGSTPPDLGSLDAEIASSQAASFAFYYCLEWLLHTTILFLGTSHWPTHSAERARASQRRDNSNYKEISARHSKALSKLRSLCAPRTPDDGVNSFRANILLGTGETPPDAETGPSARQPTSAPTSSNGGSYKTNGFPTENRYAA